MACRPCGEKKITLSLSEFKRLSLDANRGTDAVLRLAEVEAALRVALAENERLREAVRYGGEK
jgi:hypothetical protein